jgi:hypothetical protein
MLFLFFIIPLTCASQVRIESELHTITNHLRDVNANLQDMNTNLLDMKSHLYSLNYRFDLFLQMELAKKIDRMQIDGYSKIANVNMGGLVCNDISLIHNDCILPFDRAVAFCQINNTCTGISISNDINWYTRADLNGKFPARINVGKVLTGTVDWTTFYKLTD